ncbi:GNAT family N-acetyltransferase [Lysobacter firmicutimachus]|uniref:GNAT family N-acetyltransferase n=1 Tax=Lysobacter firmicutimachus TaxID=1792846 RepID=A0AAU8MNT4_9GAMM
MSPSIVALTPALAAAAFAFDSSFAVDSRLRLRSEGGAIAYDIEPLPPYRKRYGDEPGDEDLDEHFEGEQAAGFLAILDGAVIGRVLVSTAWNGLALIDDIAVDAGQRRSGAGAALLQRATDWARERGLPGVVLETQDRNVAACRFYARHGFVLGGYDRMHYAHDPALREETALFWYLDLGGLGLTPAA